MFMRATPSISRCPTRAIRPPTSAWAVTVTAVPPSSGESTMAADPRAKPGLPVASTVKRYEVGGTLSRRTTMTAKAPDTAATPIARSAWYRSSPIGRSSRQPGRHAQMALGSISTLQTSGGAAANLYVAVSSMAAGRQALEMDRKLLDAREVVDGKKVVDVLESHLHPARQRLVSRGSQERIQPDQTRAAPAHAGQLPSEQRRIAPVPAIRHDQHDGTMPHDAARPARVE